MPMGGTQGVGSGNAKGGKQRMAAPGSWPTERWVAIITIGALLLLILIRQGFRGVNLLGVKATVA